MKLKTSFFDLTTFKKNLTRFAPVWALYLIGMLLILTSSYYGSYDYFAKNSLPGMVKAFGVVNICYALVCALMLFGDLYNTRMCYSLHTQPARREALFISHFAAALCFSIVPNAVAALYLMTRLGAYWFLALYWLLAVTVQFFFFFGVASACALAVGNRIGMIALYLVANFFTMIAYWIVSTLYLPYLPGVVLNFNDFSLLCPVVNIFNASYFQFEAVQTVQGTTGYLQTFYEYAGLGSGWGYLAILGLLGLGFAVLAIFLYRARHLESAGDFVAFRKLSPVVCVVLTLCIAVGFAFFGQVMSGGLMVWLAVGLVVGWFGSRMLIERRVKVFHKKAFVGLGILAAVLAVGFMAVQYDVFGIVHFVPPVDQVESVTISNYRNTSGQYYDEIYMGNRITVTLEEEEQIEDIRKAHADILSRMNVSVKKGHTVTIQYKLKSGRTVTRCYTTHADGVNYEIFRGYFYTPQSMLGYTDWDAYVKGMETISTDGMEIPQAYLEEFLLALRADCGQGNVVTSGMQAGQVETWVYLTWRLETGGRRSRELVITSDAVNTLALLKQPKYILGYENWQDVDDLNYINVDGVDLKGRNLDGLLEALQKDAETGHIYWNGKTAYEDVQFVIEYNLDNVYRSLQITKEATYTLQWIKGDEP